MRTTKALSGKVNCLKIDEGKRAMDLNRLLQGVGGRLLRQLLGAAVKKGINRMGNTPGDSGMTKHDARRRADQTNATQKRMNDLMKIGRRFWR